MAELYRIVLLPEAVEGMESAFLWFEAESSSTQTAHTWVVGLMDAIQSLETFPERCVLAPENDYFDEEIRVHLYGNGRSVYRILFTIVGDSVQILHIRHGAQQWLRPDEQVGE